MSDGDAEDLERRQRELREEGGIVEDQLTPDEQDPLKALVDVSIGKKGTMMKQMRKQGKGRQPAEGAAVKLLVKAVDASGAPLLQERILNFPAGSGQFCEVVDEGVLFMTKGEVCEIRCTCAVHDEQLGLHVDGGGEVKFGLYLMEFEHVAALDSYDAARLAYCNTRKELGTVFFKECNWMKALKRYSHVAQKLSPVEYFQDPDIRAAAENLKRVCYLNAALVWLKLDSWRDAADLCKTVLDEDPDNVKALFRRAQALSELGQHREAEECLRRLLKLDEDNKEAARLLAKVRQEEKRGMLEIGRGFAKSAAVAAAPKKTVATVAAAAAESEGGAAAGAA